MNGSSVISDPPPTIKDGRMDVTANSKENNPNTNTTLCSRKQHAKPQRSS